MRILRSRQIDAAIGAARVSPPVDALTNHQEPHAERAVSLARAVLQGLALERQARDFRLQRAAAAGVAPFLRGAARAQNLDANQQHRLGSYDIASCI